MNPETILQIVRLSLEITLEIIRGIPIEQRQELWAQHQKNLEFWLKLFEQVQGHAPQP